jgi:hypothetical protein
MLSKKQMELLFDCNKLLHDLQGVMDNIFEQDMVEKSHMGEDTVSEYFTTSIPVDPHSQNVKTVTRCSKYTDACHNDPCPDCDIGETDRGDIL